MQTTNLLNSIGYIKLEGVDIFTLTLMCNFDLINEL